MASLRARSAQYLAVVGVPVLALVLVLRAGAGLTHGGAAATVPAAAGAGGGAVQVGLLVAQLLVVLLAARGAGLLVRRIGQPAVIGEMLAGIVLGPSVFGAFAPAASAALFPAASLGFLSALSQVGVLLFLFEVGLHLDLAELRRHASTALLASHASIAAPFVLGSVLALWLYPRFAPADVSFAPFALFLGASMSVTAFPVLARILEEKRLTHTPLGTLAIACAAVDDVTAWCLLAAVVALVRADGGGSVWLAVLGTLGFVILMLKVARPRLARLAHMPRADGRLAPVVLVTVITVALASALAAEWLGIHALFGAFLAGAVMPRDRDFARTVIDQLGALLVMLLLPLFFAYTGLRTRFDLIAAGNGVLVTGAIIGVAVAGKLGGTALAARLGGSSWRDASALGILMNTRGLMELVILNVGLDLGVLTPTLFAMMVVMALVTTVMTAPSLSLLAWMTRASTAPAPVSAARGAAGGAR